MRPPSAAVSRRPILSYPAQPAALTTLAALSLGMIPTIAPLVGYLLQLALWAAAYRYAVAVFERSANGSDDAPEWANEHDGIGWSLLILQLLFTVCIAWLGARVETPLLRWLGVALIAFLQPAMTMNAAMNRDLGAALQPERLYEVVTRLGPVYVVLVAAGVALAGVQQVVGGVVAGGRMYVMTVVGGIGLGGTQQVLGLLYGNWVTVVVAQVFAGFVWFYAMVLYFHGLGRTAFDHSARLGYEPAPVTVLRPEDRHAPLMRQVEGLAANGDHASAVRLLRECLATQPHTSPDMHARYRELLRKTGDEAGLLEHARMRIDALLVAGSTGEALRLLRESLAVDPQFRPSAAERTTQLAQAAVDQGEPALAIALLRDFTLRHPRDEAIPANARLLSRLLLEQGAGAQAARDALQAAIDRMLPAHPDYVALIGERDRLARAD